MISVQHLTYEYPDTKALDDVSFTVQERTITALVGPNASGKYPCNISIPRRVHSLKAGIKQTCRDHVKEWVFNNQKTGYESAGGVASTHGRIEPLLSRLLFFRTRKNHPGPGKMTEERKKSFSGWLTQARTFFSSLLADPVLLDRYTQYGNPPDAVNAAFALIQAAEQANTAKVKAG